SCASRTPAPSGPASPSCCPPASPRRPRPTRRTSMRRARAAAPLAAISALVLTAACAPRPGEPEPLPRHPFPRWVDTLEVGESDVEQVRARFGAPDAIEQSALGGTIYRYRLAEIHWPDD